MNSLDSLLREKAYNEIKQMLQKEGIDIEKIEQEELEALVNEKVNIMNSHLKGIGVGIGLSVLVSIFGF